MLVGVGEELRGHGLGRVVGFAQPGVGGCPEPWFVVSWGTSSIPQAQVQNANYGQTDDIPMHLRRLVALRDQTCQFPRGYFL